MRDTEKDGLEHESRRLESQKMTVRLAPFDQGSDGPGVMGDIGKLKANPASRTERAPVISLYDNSCGVIVDREHTGAIWR